MHKKSGVVWRKRMRLLARDLKPVTLMKVNGDLYHGIRVNLQSSVNKLLTQAFDIPFEEGDFIERELKNGITEKYIILKINYSTNVINMDIEKVTDLTKNRGEKIMEERERIVNNTNNFYGEATGIQMQVKLKHGILIMAGSQWSYLLTYQIWFLKCRYLLQFQNYKMCITQVKVQYVYL